MNIARLVLLLAAVTTAVGLSPFSTASVAAAGAPAVSGVTVTSDSGSDATYARGETIRVTVTFSEAVEVDTSGGTPQLTIDMDPAHWGEKRAVYESGSGTAALVFAHEVVEPNISTQGIAVLADTLALDGGTIRSASTQADAALGHGGLAHDPAHKVDWQLAPGGTPGDATPPRLVRGEIDGGTMRLFFSEALDPASTGGEFHMGVEDPELGVVGFVAAGDVTVEGAVVTVGLGAGYPRAEAGLERNDVLYARRADGGGRALRDLAGNQVLTVHPMYRSNGEEWRYVRIDLDNVTGAVPAMSRDTTPPRLSRTVVDGTKLTLAFNEAIDDAASPASGAFTVKKTPQGSGEETVGLSGTPAVKGVAVTLTLVEAVRDTDTDLKVSYSKADTGASNRLRDAAGNEVAGFTDEPVKNIDADTTPPRLVRGEINGGTMTLFFSEPLDEDSVGGFFRVELGYPKCDSIYYRACGHAFNATGQIQISGNTVTVGLGSFRGSQLRAQVGGYTYFRYYGPTNPSVNGLRDLAGNEVGSTRRISLDNLTGVASAMTGVEVSSAAGDDATYGLGDTIRIRLTFSKAVTVTGAPRLRIDLSSGTGGERWADYEEGTGTKTLEFAYTVVARDLSTDGVAVPANTLELNGGTIESALTAGENADLAHDGLAHDANHKVDTIPPKLSAAMMDGVTLTLTFNETLGAAASLANGAFTVRKTPSGSSDQDVSLRGSPSIDGTTVTLTLANAVLDTDDVKVSYTRPTTGTGNRLRDAAGNEAASFFDEVVRPDTTPPRLERGEVDGGTMTLYFSEPLDPDSVGGSFRVTLERVRNSWNSFEANGAVAISGNMVTVELGVRRAKAGLRAFMYYHKPTDPDAKQLRDLVGNAVITSNLPSDRYILGSGPIKPCDMVCGAVCKPNI